MTPWVRLPWCKMNDITFTTKLLHNMNLQLKTICSVHRPILHECCSCCSWQLESLTIYTFNNWHLATLVSSNPSCHHLCHTSSTAPPSGHTGCHTSGHKSSRDWLTKQKNMCASESMGHCFHCSCQCLIC